MPSQKTKRTNSTGVAILLTMLMTLVAADSFWGSALGQTAQITHDTKSEFQNGVFDQTVLRGTEESPKIKIGPQKVFSWAFDDSAFTSGWKPIKSGLLAVAEAISGQIHLKAQRSSGEIESFAFFSKSVSPADKFVVEYRIKFIRIEPSGVAVPGDALLTQPKGACARLDLFKSGRGGLRVDIFADKMVSVWTRNFSLKDYPTTAYVNVPTELSRWYTLRFEGDFADPAFRVQVYRDNIPIGELKGHPNNIGTTLRPMAYSRRPGTISEIYVDSIRMGAVKTVLPPQGTYTSPVLDLGAGALGNLSWREQNIFGDTFPYPWHEWDRFWGNPILDDLHTIHNFVENILVDVNDSLQTPIRYPHPTLGEKYWLVYANPSEIRLAYSDDLIHWTPYEGNPVLTHGTGEISVSTPQLFKDGSRFYMIHDAGMGSPHGLATRLTFSTAPSPLGPWTRGPVILDIGAPGKWDEGRVTEPFVFKDGGMYYLFYMGDILPPYCRREQIGLATTPAANFPRGPWTKRGLVLPANPDPAGWDRGLTADPSIIKVGDTFYMLYTGSYGDAQWKLGIAWAKNPLGPWNRPPAPSLEPVPGSWMSDSLLRGAIHYHEGKFILPFSGTDTKKFRGGIATAEANIPEILITFETRTSPDGVQWEEWRPVLNGAPISSTPNRYFQYRSRFHLSRSGKTPILLSVTLNYE